jgi:uncharacterized protein involved in exopolysaccharide biosynthesis
MDPNTASPEYVNSASQDTDDFEITLHDILKILQARWRYIGAATISATVLAAIGLLLVPNRYTATVVLLPPGQSSASSALLSQLGGSASLASAASSSLGIKSSGEMYVALMHSRTVEEAVVKRFGLQNHYHAKLLTDARTKFEAHSKVSYGMKDGLITLNVIDNDPKFASDIANGYMEEFVRLSSNLAITEASQRRMFFQQQLVDAKTHLTSAEQALQQTQVSTGVVQIDSQTRAMLETVVSLRAQIAAKEVQLQGMRSYATNDNPEVQQVQEQLSALQSQVSKYGSLDRDSGLIAPKGKVSEDGLEYLRRVRDVKYYEAISELIAKQYEMAKLDEARQGAPIQVVDSAVPPERHSSPRRGMLTLSAFFLALLGACGWSILVDGSRLRTSHNTARHPIKAQ